MSNNQKLNEKRRKILNYLKNSGEQTTKKIFENSDTDYSSKNSLNNALNRLKNHGYLKKTNPKGQSNYWKLTEKGREAISARKIDVKDSTLEYGELVRRLGDFVQEKLQDDIAHAIKKDKKSWIEVSLPDLDRFDKEIVNKLLKDPDTVLEAFEEVVENSSLVGREDSLEVRIVDLPEEDTVKLSEIYSENIGHFVAVEGIITNNILSKPAVKSGIFECAKCGDQYKKEQDSSHLKSPYKCECGSRKFEVVEKILQDTKTISIQERTSKPNPRKREVYLEGSLARNKELENASLGSLIRVNGILRDRPLKKNSKKLEPYIEANSIEFKDKNEVEEISEEIQEQVQELSKNPEIKSKLKESVAQGKIGGLDRVKEGYLLYRLGKFPEGDIHLLIAGEPGVGKSELVSTSAETLPRTVYTVLENSTSTGITASLTEDKKKGGYEVNANALVKADDGFFIGDEAGKFNDSYSCFNTPMEDGEVNRSAGDKDIRLPAKASVCLVMNPSDVNDRRWDGKPSIDDLPVSSQSDILSRFHLKIAIPSQEIGGSDSLRREIRKAEKVLSSDENRAELDLDIYRAYLSVAEDINPEISEEGEELLKRIYVGLSLKNYTLSPRTLIALKRIAKAYSRIRLENKVSEERVIEAYIFWKECQATLYEEFREEKRRVTESSGFQKQKPSLLGELLEVLSRNNGRMRKEDLKEELELGGSESKREKVFGELIEDALEQNAVSEEGQFIYLEKEPDFFGGEVVEILENI